MKTSKSQGWYYFEDGYYAWYHGLSKTELKWEVMKHGKLVRFHK